MQIYTELLIWNKFYRTNQTIRKEYVITMMKEVIQLDEGKAFGELALLHK